MLYADPAQHPATAGQGLDDVDDVDDLLTHALFAHDFSGLHRIIGACPRDRVLTSPLANEKMREREVTGGGDQANEIGKQRKTRLTGRHKVQSEEGGGLLIMMHGRRRMTIDPRIPPMPGRKHVQP